MFLSDNYFTRPVNARDINEVKYFAHKERWINFKIEIAGGVREMEPSEFSRRLIDILANVIPDYPDGDCENCGFASVEEGIYCEGCYREGVLRQVNSLWDVAQEDIKEFVYCTSYCFPDLMKEVVDELRKERLDVAPILSEIKKENLG